MRRETLLQLFESHRGKVADKWQLYLEEYERILSPYRDKSVRLLEIGVQNGGSLEIWARYFPNAQVLVGCDIDPLCAELVFNDPRISVVVGDVNSDDAQAEISAVSTAFDIIIDDGSHKSGDIIRSFGLLFPRLALGGCYVIEDLHCSYWGVYEGGLNYPFSSIAFLKSLADVLNRNHWGLEKESDSILDGFKIVYGAEIDRESLRQIHSVEFTDSVCTIRKFPGNMNVLGKRVISGNRAPVVPVENLGSHADEKSIVPSQKDNHWANGDFPSADELLSKVHEIHEQKKWIAKLMATIDERDAQVGELLEIIKNRNEELELLRQSLSWRITAPLRRFERSNDSNGPVQQNSDPCISRTKYLPSKPADCSEIEPRPPSGSPGKQDVAHSVPGEFKHSSPTEDAFVRSTRPLFELLKAREASDSKFSGADQAPVSDRNDYEEWTRRFDTLRDTDRIRIRQAIDDMARKPLLSILLPANNSNTEWTRQAVQSIQNQLYDNWELCIVGNPSTGKSLIDYLSALPATNARIKFVPNRSNGHYFTAMNSALQCCTGSWVALMNQEDILPEHALFHVARTINLHPETALIYSDEDQIDNKGTRSKPYFKCDWNRDLFYSHNLISNLVVYRKEVLDEIGGFRKGFEGAEDYDLALRCIERIDSGTIRHIPRVLYHRRGHRNRTEEGTDAETRDISARRSALQTHLDRTGTSAIAESFPYGNRVRYALPGNPPLVSLIIPTKNGLSLLKNCLESIESKTTYPNFEILVVDNGSDEPATIDFIASLRGNPRIRVLHDARPFNYAELNNSAVEEARGELICLLNNDTEVIENDWLTEMVSIALQPGVGFVGAKLLYPDGTIQHAGVILGIRGVAAHTFKKAPGDSPGYFDRPRLISSFSALTGACLVTRKSVFQEAGGLDSENLAIAFNDIDLCIRVRELGYRNVFTPYALLYHHESASRGYEDTPQKKARFAKEVAFMKERWGDKLLNDPAYSPNLTLNELDFSLAWPPRLKEGY